MGVLVRKLKFDGSVKSEWQGERLPFDHPGWVVVLHHPDRHVKFTGGQRQPHTDPFVHCCHLTHPLSVLLQFDPAGHFLEAKCDAALPATMQADSVAFVDLDLDLIVQPVPGADLTWYVQDHDDFAVRRRRMNYSPDAVEQAYQGLALARELVAARHFPFDNRLVPQLDLDALQAID